MAIRQEKTTPYNPYGVLGLNNNATPEQIEQTFYSMGYVLAKQRKDDPGNAEVYDTRFKDIYRAYRALGSPQIKKTTEQSKGPAPTTTSIKTDPKEQKIDIPSLTDQEKVSPTKPVPVVTGPAMDIPKTWTSLKFKEPPAELTKTLNTQTGTSADKTTVPSAPHKKPGPDKPPQRLTDRVAANPHTRKAVLSTAGRGGLAALALESMFLGGMAYKAGSEAGEHATQEIEYARDAYRDNARYGEIKEVSKDTGGANPFTTNPPPDTSTHALQINENYRRQLFGLSNNIRLLQLSRNQNVQLTPEASVQLQQFQNELASAGIDPSKIPDKQLSEGVKESLKYAQTHPNSAGDFQAYQEQANDPHADVRVEVEKKSKQDGYTTGAVAASVVALGAAASLRKRTAWNGIPWELPSISRSYEDAPPIGHLYLPPIGAKIITGLNMPQDNKLHPHISAELLADSIIDFSDNMNRGNREQGKEDIPIGVQYTLQGRLPDKAKFIPTALILDSPDRIDWSKFHYGAEDKSGHEWAKVGPLIHDGGAKYTESINHRWKGVQGRTDYLHDTFLLPTDLTNEEAQQIRKNEEDRLRAHATFFQRAGLALHSKNGTAPKTIPKEMRDQLASAWDDFESGSSSLVGDAFSTVPKDGQKKSPFQTLRDERRAAAYLHTPWLTAKGDIPGWNKEQGERRHEGKWSRIRKQLERLEDARHQDTGKMEDLHHKSSDLMAKTSGRVDEILGIKQQPEPAGISSHHSVTSK